MIDIYYFNDYFDVYILDFQIKITHHSVIKRTMSICKGLFCVLIGWTSACKTLHVATVSLWRDIHVIVVKDTSHTEWRTMKKEEVKGIMRLMWTISCGKWHAKIKPLKHWKRTRRHCKPKTVPNQTIWWLGIIRL